MEGCEPADAPLTTVGTGCGLDMVCGLRPASCVSSWDTLCELRWCESSRPWTRYTHNVDLAENQHRKRRGGRGHSEAELVSGGDVVACFHRGLCAKRTRAGAASQYWRRWGWASVGLRRTQRRVQPAWRHDGRELAGRACVKVQRKI